MPLTQDWLPPICELSAYDGNVENYFEALYQIFKRDFIDAPLLFRSKPIRFDNRISYQGKPETFWHIASSNEPGISERLPDLKRCERIGWIKAIIENHQDQSVLVWEKDHFREHRILIFLEPQDYLIVLSQKNNIYVLITAYCTDHPSSKQKLLKEYRKLTTR